jgi:hypothetical protein
MPGEGQTIEGRQDHDKKRFAMAKVGLGPITVVSSQCPALLSFPSNPYALLTHGFSIEN